MGQIPVTLKSGKDRGSLFVQNFSCFNVGDYIDILITVHVKILQVNYDNLFMFQSHPRSFKQEFRTGGRINEKTLPLIKTQQDKI